MENVARWLEAGTRLGRKHAGYLVRTDGLTASEKRWNRKYHGSICNFGETIMFRVANARKGQLSWHEGIWLGRDTESDMHFVVFFEPLPYAP